MRLTAPSVRPSSQVTPGSTAKHPRRFAAAEVLAWSVWLGLAGGLLEVGTRFVCRVIDPTKRLFMMSRHFIWLTPVANLVFFLSLGLLLAGATWFWPRQGRWLSTRLLLALAIQPMLLVAWPAIYPAAWFVTALGFASLLARWTEAQSPRRRMRIWAWGLPALAAVIALLAGSRFGDDWWKQRLETRHPLPPAGSPNVLFVVLDTVRADRLSVYGYRRPTTPHLERLARNGIRFENARATAPWTLPSHASFFSGLWPHEFDAQWLTPLRWRDPTLAEHLASRGYATAGIVGNTGYCSYDTGLARGFTHYEDYTLKKLSFLRMSPLFTGMLGYIYEYGYNHEFGPLRSAPELIERWFFAEQRKSAASVNRAFLDWLAHRPEPSRPFFAFLNYFDVHSPYTVREGTQHRFGHKPQSREEIRIIDYAWDTVDKRTLPRYFVTMARDAYDSCISYLDEQLGVLFDELERRGVLENTIVVITSDHGEGLGEHGLFDHGTSLYRTELHVPLLILLPGQSRTARVIREVVSLRDLPATIVDLAGQSARSPFPGHSLADFWRNPGGQPAAASPVFSELFVPNPRGANAGGSPAGQGALVALAEGDYVYVRNEPDGREKLFNEREDPLELSSRAGQSEMKPVLDRLRNQVLTFRTVKH